MNDVINREVAIDAVLGIGHTAKLNDGDTVVRMSAVNHVLRNLPSAQPERCEDCVNFSKTRLLIPQPEPCEDAVSRNAVLGLLYNTMESSFIKRNVLELPSVRTSLPESEDAVSRHALIEAHYDYCNEHPDASFPTWSLRLMKYAPSVHSDRKKGKWIEHNPHKWGLGIVFECSECGEKIDCEQSNFCPNCGAEMEGQG